MAIQPTRTDWLCFLILDTQKAADAFETFTNGMIELKHAEPLKSYYKNELCNCLTIFQNFFIAKGNVLRAQNGSQNEIVRFKQASDQAYQELFEMIARANRAIPIDPKKPSVGYRKDVLEKERTRITQMIAADKADPRYFKLLDQLVTTLRTIPDFNTPDFVAFVKKHLITLK